MLGRECIVGRELYWALVHICLYLCGMCNRAFISAKCTWPILTASCLTFSRGPLYGRFNFSHSYFVEWHSIWPRFYLSVMSVFLCSINIVNLAFTITHAHKHIYSYRVNKFILQRIVSTRKWICIMNKQITVSYLISRQIS